MIRVLVAGDMQILADTLAAVPASAPCLTPRERITRSRQPASAGTQS